MKILFPVILFSCFFINSTYAQEGKISGTINDLEVNDVLPFANVGVKGTTIGTTSDFEGDYSLNVDEGTYTIVFSFVGYETVEVTEVKVEEGQTTPLNVNMEASSASLDEVVITTTTARDTESAVLNMQRNSVNLTDGLSSQTFAKLGASDVTSAVKTVPGVSVQGGKYVYVRGLGDRYTKSILNGVDIPGLDPDRNTIQLDIFPTNILDNIMVVKSSTADMPADFTGGIVNIVTKDFPTKEEYSFSVSGTYNPDMHFNSNFLSYEGSSTDFLGFDNGQRDLPLSRDVKTPRPFDQNPFLTTITQAFDPTMAGTRAPNNMDYSIGFTAGDQYDVGKNRLGYFAAASYKNTTEYFSDFQNNTFLKPRERDEFELRENNVQRGDVGVENVLLSGLAGLAYKTDQSKYQLNVMHIQNGESTAGYLREDIYISDAVTLFKDNLQYTQRSITNALLTGKHTNEDASWTTEWKLSPTISSIYDKDVRLSAFEYNENTDTYTIRPSSSGNPTRIWRDLDEINLVGKLDLTKKHRLFNKDALLKFGGGYTYKERDFSIDQYRVLLEGAVSPNFNGNSNAILADENIWTVESDEGSYMNGNYEIANTFNSYNSNISAYISEELHFTDKFKAILGLRFEKFDLYYTGESQDGRVYDEENVIDLADFFPSANLIYSVGRNSNLRLSYSRTTARPSFKEASIAQIYDPLTDRIFIGNIDLDPTYISNADARYELYGDNAQLFAVSAFYKSFTDPIELTIFSEAAPSNFQPRNVGEAQVYGAELEVRKNFDFIGLDKISANFNLSIIESRVEMDKSPNGEYESRERNLREGETLDDTRNLQGQSPYLINSGIDYADAEKGWQAGIYYNVKGETLEIVGLGTVPDIYTMPFHSLNVNLNKTFGKEKNSSISLKVSNILGDDLESNFQSYGAENQIFSLRQPGTQFSLGYSYKF